MLETEHRDCFAMRDPGDKRVHLGSAGMKRSRQSSATSRSVAAPRGRRASARRLSRHRARRSHGASAWLSGHPCLAASLNVNYRQMVPINSTMHLEARVLEVIDRKVTITAELRDASGEILADSRGLFIKTRTERFAHLVNEGTNPFHRWLQKGLI